MTITTTTIGSRHTLPGILVRLDDLYYSSRDTLIYDGHEWEASAISLAGLSEDGKGFGELRLQLADNSSEWPYRILAGIGAELICQCSIVYIETDGSISAQLLFDGTITAVNITNDRQGQSIAITASKDGPAVYWTPRIAWRSPYAVRRGTEITVNEETFRLE